MSHIEKMSLGDMKVAGFFFFFDTCRFPFFFYTVPILGMELVERFRFILERLFISLIRLNHLLVMNQYFIFGYLSTYFVSKSLIYL